MIVKFRSKTNERMDPTRTGIAAGRHVGDKGMDGPTWPQKPPNASCKQTKRMPRDIGNPDPSLLAKRDARMFFPATACLVQDRIGDSKSVGLSIYRPGWLLL